MSKFDYDKARSTAEKLIDKFGGAGTVYSLGEGGEDMFGNPISSPGFSIDGLASPLLPYGTSTQMTVYERDNVIAGDMFFFFHSDELVEFGMLFDANGYSWRVQSIKRLSSLDDVNVFQKVMLRK